MKIAFIVNTGNFINFYRYFIPKLIGEKNEIDIICDCRKSKVPKQFYDLGCSIVQINFSRSPISIDNVKAIKCIKNIILKNKYDIVHCHTGITGVLTRLAIKKIKNRDFKVFYTPHGLNFNNNGNLLNWILFYPIEKNLSKYTDVIFTMNRKEDEIVRQKFDAGKVIFTHGVGLDVNSFEIEKKESKIVKELEVQENEVIILSIGELTNRKNHSLVIKALSKIKNENFVYLIAGEGPNRKKIEKLSKKYKISEKVKLLGYRKDIPNIILSSDIFVFPSLLEGLPVSLMEAMAGNLPCVVSDISGNTDLIENEKGGFIFKSGDVKTCSYYLARLISDNKLRKEMGNYNKKIILDYDWKKVNEEMIVAYENNK